MYETFAIASARAKEIVAMLGSEVVVRRDGTGWQLDYDRDLERTIKAELAAEEPNDLGTSVSFSNGIRYTRGEYNGDGHFAGNVGQPTAWQEPLSAFGIREDYSDEDETRSDLCEEADEYGEGLARSDSDGWFYED